MRFVLLAAVAPLVLFGVEAAPVVAEDNAAAAVEAVKAPEPVTVENAPPEPAQTETETAQPEEETASAPLSEEEERHMMIEEYATEVGMDVASSMEPVYLKDTVYVPTLNWVAATNEKGEEMSPEEFEEAEAETEEHVDIDPEPQEEEAETAEDRHLLGYRPQPFRPGNYNPPGLRGGLGYTPNPPGPRGGRGYGYGPNPPGPRGGIGVGRGRFRGLYRPQPFRPGNYNPPGLRGGLGYTPNPPGPRGGRGYGYGPNPPGPRGGIGVGRGRFRGLQAFRYNPPGPRGGIGRTPNPPGPVGGRGYGYGPNPPGPVGGVGVGRRRGLQGDEGESFDDVNPEEEGQMTDEEIAAIEEEAMDLENSLKPIFLEDRVLVPEISWSPVGNPNEKISQDQFAEMIADVEAKAIAAEEANAPQLRM
uniref:Uncharacterized protein n=1 Tax=Chromera velia CCMP2878 TaxID=1169474 RepID=A0A0G4FQ87_9ALVE|eukprot:Cvel_3579.t1-p1 / transcript=Cvel_3579.t1 / gene=Cvel_3579 / organism=Chromera_velia_CCMP2878 / gene_product=hypothetical protein / transcript_product=hypothetical protein / location=Cvel_scaffold146:76700-79569(+) / protein_length=417 / sequence_SO=supercontig / SO=protein_coding / is_pseudo=false